MNHLSIGAILICSIFVLQGCNLFESTLDKQTKMCIDDEKKILNDPNSLEILSTETFQMKDGEDGNFRVQVFYTAKNLAGGRARGQTLCGFKNKDSLEFNGADLMERSRQINLSFNSRVR